MEKGEGIRYFHLIVVSSYLFYIFLHQDRIHPYHYPLLLAMSIGIAGYHVFRMVQRGGVHWANLFHVLVVAPLLFSVGYLRQGTPKMVYELIGILAFAAWYHMMHLQWVRRFFV